jgi:hypothetical protein
MMVSLRRIISENQNIIVGKTMWKSPNFGWVKESGMTVVPLDIIFIP